LQDSSQLIHRAIMGKLTKMRKCIISAIIMAMK